MSLTSEKLITTDQIDSLVEFREGEYFKRDCGIYKI
jgi:hypothetical protein